MCSLLNRICVLLQCPPTDVPEALKNLDKLQYLCVELSKGRIFTTHLPENREVKFGGFGQLPASEQYALNGYLKITVQQYYFLSKHKIRRLMYAYLPCVVERQNNGHVDYFPIECLQWEYAGKQ